MGGASRPLHILCQKALRKRRKLKLYVARKTGVKKSLVITMPYSVRKRGKQYMVVNKRTGKVKGTHSSKAKANRQLRALYANVPHAKKKRK